jgi:hypothetical protein
MFAIAATRFAFGFVISLRWSALLLAATCAILAALCVRSDTHAMTGNDLTEDGTPDGGSR